MLNPFTHKKVLRNGVPGATVTSYPPQEIQLGALVGEDDTIGKLDRLAALRDAGVPTEAEFAEQKRRLLDGA